jgi:SPP1 family predicted phage head-tail adaptor
MRLLDRTALIEVPTTTRDAYGAVIPGWETLATVRASISPLRGDEYRADNAQAARAQHAVTIRWRSDVTPKCRVTIESRVMDVQATSELGRRRLLRLICEEIT